MTKHVCLKQESSSLQRMNVCRLKPHEVEQISHKEGIMSSFQEWWLKLLTELRGVQFEKFISRRPSQAMKVHAGLKNFGRTCKLR